MKSILSRFTAACSVLTLGLLFGVPAHADYTFNVGIDTSALVAPNPLSVNGPFSLNFQLIGDQSNTVTLSNFLFGAGGGISGTSSTFGDATGDLSGTVTLSTASNFFNSFTQGFTPGSLLTFDVSVTTNVVGPTPDAFTVAILDSSDVEIDTEGFADQLIQVDIGGETPNTDAYAGSGDYVSLSAPTVTSRVPEPTPMFLLVFALPIIARQLRRLPGGRRA